MDKVLMGHAFDIHNTLGRFCNERVYQNELDHRCGECGIETHREVELRVSHQDFSKIFYLDLLVERGMIYELKAVEALDTSHQKQLINYLLLSGISHGKLVNFRPGSVESRFVSARLKIQDRVTFQVDERAWLGHEPPSQRLRDTLHALLVDWGTLLDINLYREALLHFTSGQDAGIQPVNIEVNGRCVGAQKMCLLDDEKAWHLSAVRTHLPSYEVHLTRLLRHTRLKCIHWLNLDQRLITLKTLQK